MLNFYFNKMLNYFYLNKSLSGNIIKSIWSNQPNNPYNNFKISL